MTKLEELKAKMEEVKKQAKKLEEKAYNERFAMLRKSFKTLSDEEIHQMMRK